MAVDTRPETERYRFACWRCLAVWCRQYTVRRWQDDEGTIFETYRVLGIVMPSPHSGVSCPACGGLRVTVDRRTDLGRPRLLATGPATPSARPPARVQRVAQVHYFP